MRENELITRFNEFRYFTKVTIFTVADRHTFYNCINLEEIDFRNIISITGGSDVGILSGTKVKIVKLPVCTFIGSYVYRNPNTIISIICGDKVEKVGRYITNVTNNTAKRLVIKSLIPPGYEPQGFGGDRITNWNSSCKIYVPDDVVDDYKATTVFANVKSYIFPLSEYPSPEELVWDE